MEKVSLQEFRELAYRAFYWTYFSPDKKRDRTLAEHEDQLNNDLESIPEEERERYITNYKKYFSAWLSAHSNCASSAITGGSGFNVRRAEKANSREHAKYGELIEWREKAQKAIKRKIEAAKSPEQKQNEEWTFLKRSIVSSARTIKEINDGANRYSSKALFVSSIYKKVETFAKRGDVEIVQKAINLIRELNKESSIITERHKFFKLPQVAESNHENQLEQSQRANGELPFEGGKIVQNWAENRVQILFDEKPSRDVIDLLKKSAFRWSPRNMAWQRQNTNSGVYAAKEVVKNMQR